jgi:DNA mismatch endonuclease (patch repair protein)
MAAIRGKDTKPESVVRSALHRAGLRFRLHRRDLPGTPDIVLAKYRSVVMVHGCFWHHHGCAKSTWPTTRAEFWRKKILANVDRDRRTRVFLRAAGWKVFVIWECEISPRRLATLARKVRGQNPDP